MPFSFSLWKALERKLSFALNAELSVEVGPAGMANPKAPAFLAGEFSELIDRQELLALAANLVAFLGMSGAGVGIGFEVWKKAQPIVVNGFRRWARSRDRLGKIEFRLRSIHVPMLSGPRKRAMIFIVNVTRNREGCGMSLSVVPMTLEQANAFVTEHHRHHDPVAGCKFCIAVADADGLVRGVAIVGRPIARMLDTGWTLEVNRVCTDGVHNGCSMLYGAAWRAAKALGFRRLITYTLAEEGGASLRGAGWKLIGERGGGSWSRAERPRVDTHPLQTKLMWEATP